MALLTLILGLDVASRDCLQWYLSYRKPGCFLKLHFLPDRGKEWQFRLKGAWNEQKNILEGHGIRGAPHDGAATVEGGGPNG